MIERLDRARRGFRQPTSTLEFLIRADSTAARLPTFEPVVEIPQRSRVSTVLFPVAIASVFIIGALLIRLAF